jgi:hypothetical protein
MTVRRCVPAAILRWISRITRRGKSNDKNLDALLTALHPGNESPAQQPGFFLPILCAGINGGLRASMSVRGSAPRRRESSVEEESTQRVVDLAAHPPAARQRKRAKKSPIPSRRTSDRLERASVLIRTVCGLAGSMSFLDEIDAEIREAGLDNRPRPGSDSDRLRGRVRPGRGWDSSPA